VILAGAVERAMRMREEDFSVRASYRTRMERGGGLKPGLARFRLKL